VGFFEFFGDEKMVKLRKVEVNVYLKKGVASYLCIAYVSMFMFLFANIYTRWWFRIQPRCWMVLQLGGCCLGENGWLHDEVRPMSLHGFTAVFALLGDGSLCVCVSWKDVQRTFYQ